MGYLLPAFRGISIASLSVIGIALAFLEIRVTPFAPVFNVSHDLALVFAFVNIELILEELECHLNVFLHIENLAEVVTENRPE